MSDPIPFVAKPRIAQPDADIRLGPTQRVLIYGRADSRPPKVDVVLARDGLDDPLDLTPEQAILIAAGLLEAAKKVGGW